MKARCLIVRALLLISLLAPFGHRAFGSRISSPSCRILKRSYETRNHQIDRTSLDVVLAAPAHRAPAQRMHRLRGKRINLDPSFVLPPAPSLVAEPVSLLITLHTQDLNGPNPSRGPPSLALI
ncbi:MAG: hypothetical protein JST28_10640 [Acidobacteria bacterium]|nr:hypothetical protein [Acidobacteriota bacterium]